MKIILLKDVQNVGRKFETKNVSDGFAMNSLIPQKLAEIATSGALKRLDTAMKRNEEHKKIQSDLLAKNIEGLQDITVKMQGKGNEQGHLFAAIHKADLIAAIKEQTKLDIDEDHITIDKPIKEAGEHTIKIKADDKEGEIKLIVETEK